MKKTVRTIAALLAAFILVLSVACKGETDSAYYDYAGTPTVAPYTVYNEDGTVAGEQGGYSNLFLAMRYAGAHTTGANKMSVKDGNGLKIFERESRSNCWVFDGTNFVGNMELHEATAWAAQHPRSYVFDGQGKNYIYLGSDDYTERHVENVYGTTSAYSNLYTPNGYSYVSATVRLSEATYCDEPTNPCNAYIFFNVRGLVNCDMGIGCVAGDNGKWKVIHCCSEQSHPQDASSEKSKFYLYPDQVVTTMRRDEATGIYSGADDLFIEAEGTKDAWILKITNLRTKEQFGYTHVHEGMNAGGESFFRLDAAMSFIPVGNTVWDPRGGGFLKNVVMENVRVAKYKEGGYTEEDKEEFYPGLPAVKYAFTQGADCAHLTIGAHKKAGRYKSGASYEEGGKYIAFSTYYDGTHIET